MRTISPVTRRSLLVALLVTLTCATLWAAKPAPPPPPPTPPPFRFDLVLLGTLGGTWSHAKGINEAGDVVGYSAIASGRQHGFVYFAGDAQMTDINSLVDPTAVDPTWQNGWEITAVGEINDNLEMMAGGRLFVDGVNTRYSLLFLAPDPEAGHWTLFEVEPDFAFAHDLGGGVDMNSDGDLAFLAGPFERKTPHLWTAEDGLVELGELNGRHSAVQGITDRDAQGKIEIVGITTDGTPARAWRTTYTVGAGAPTGMQDLGYKYQDQTTPGESQAVDISSNGSMIFGETTVAKGDIFAAIYSNGSWTSLGTLNPNAKKGNWNNSWSRAGNDLGYVIGASMVGTSSSVPNMRTFIYHSSFKMWNLDSLIDASVPIEMGLDFCGISNLNLIGGTLGNGINQAFVLVPYEP